MRNLITLILILFSAQAWSQTLLFRSQKQLFVSHEKSVNISDLYKQGQISLITDSGLPVSYSKSVKFNRPWYSYYDYTSRKFLQKKNSSKRILPLRVDFFRQDSLIYDTEYSQFQILSHDEVGYRCIDVSVSTKEFGLKCDIIIYNGFFFIQYENKTYIYSQSL